MDGEIVMKLSNRGFVTMLFMILCIGLIIVLGILETKYPTVDLQLREEVKVMLNG